MLKALSADALFKEHCFFALVFGMLFVSPEVMVGYFLPNFLVSSSVSLGLIPLFLWLVFQLKQYGMMSILLLRASKPITILVLFAGFALLNSFIQSDMLGQLMALQWFLYCYVSAIIFSGYLLRVKDSSDAEPMIMVLTLVGVIIGVGGLISLFTGPIYPFQTINNIGRIWCGVHLPQAVGFGVNANAVAGTLTFFMLIVMLFAPISRVLRIGSLIVLLFSLLCTLSRSGLVTFLVACVSLYALLLLLRICKKDDFTRIKGRFIDLGVGVLVTTIMVSALFILKPEIYDITRYGVGLGSTGVCAGSVEAGSVEAGSVLTEVVVSESARLQLWRGAAIDFWDSDLIQKVFGGGWGREAVYVDVYAGNKILVTVHSSYLAVLLDSGLIGFLSFFLVFILSMFQAFRLAINGRKEGFFGFCFLLAFAFHGITETYIFGVQYVVLLVFTLAMIEVCPSYTHRTEAHK